MLSFDEIKSNCEKARREVGGGVILLGATKSRPKSVVDFVLDNGLLDCVGENRVQEFVAKYDPSSEQPFNVKTPQPAATRYHFIGRLQTNKVKYIVGKADIIHSLDSVRLGAEIDKRARLLGVVQKCLAEVNVGGEPEKGGVSVSELASFVKTVTESYKNIEICGLMGVVPKIKTHSRPNGGWVGGWVGESVGDCGAAELIAFYKTLDKVFRTMKNEYPKFEILSAGMSDDFKIAIEYGGSGLVRLGSYIFGKREELV